MIILLIIHSDINSTLSVISSEIMLKELVVILFIIYDLHPMEKGI